MSEPNPELETFVTHRLRGARFEGHAIPVTVLPDLTAYRELVLEVARALFFLDNPERQRVPKGFDENFDLVLRQIQDGSACAPLERRRGKSSSGDSSQLPLPNAQAPDYFEQARDLVNQTIEAMRLGQPAPPKFPLSAVRHFNNFGRTLRDNETIEIQGPRGASRASYNKQVRKRLVLLREKTYEDLVEITGRIVQFDTQKRTFGILVNDHTVIGPLDGLSDEQLHTVRTAAVHTENLRIRVSGIGAYDPLDRLVRIVSVKDLAFTEDEGLREQLEVAKRLAVLAELPDGWLDGDGSAIGKAAVSWIADVLARAEAEGLPRPYLYPTLEGNVQAEWSFPDTEVSALFEYETRSASCVGVHTKSGAQRDEDIDLDAPDGIKKLVAFVGRFAP